MGHARGGRPISACHQDSPGRGSAGNTVETTVAQRTRPVPRSFRPCFPHFPSCLRAPETQHLWSPEQRGRAARRKPAGLVAPTGGLTPRRSPKPDLRLSSKLPSQQPTPPGDNILARPACLCLLAPRCAEAPSVTKRWVTVGDGDNGGQSRTAASEASASRLFLPFPACRHPDPLPRARQEKCHRSALRR